MKRITRREFLRMAAIGAGSAIAAPLLNACGKTPTPTEPASPTNTPFFPEGVFPPGADTPTATATAVPTQTPFPTETATLPPTATPTPEASYLAVARGGDDPEALVRRAIAAIGGIERFVPPGASVLIKPNVCVAHRRYQFAATTNPWVVGALVKMCREAGASRVRVYDFPFGGTSVDAFNVSGIADQVIAAGGELEYVQYEKFISTELPEGKSLRFADIYSEVLNADVLINVPIGKSHGLTGLTLGMKNLMGVVRVPSAIHSGVHQKLADLTAFLRPELTVVDAVRILLAGGPSGGSLGDVRKCDTVIASADPVAADAYATTLFGYSDPNQFGFIKYGAEMGLGRNDIKNLKIEVIAVGG